ncbi:MAG TPA: type II CAAX endopeptidase family protein [Longimicrobiales bacterium]|nr:type II CAAX endopeptidase family protein [Longimicrobiales bacterium]
MSDARGRWLVLLVIAAASIAWLAAGELPTPARLVTVVLVAVLPALLLAQGTIRSDEIAGLPIVPAYLSSMIMIWGIGAAAVWAGLASGMPAARLGFVSIDAVDGLVWTGAITLVALAVLAAGRMLGRREAPLLERLLPRTAVERAVFVLLSLSAGAGEELAFRSFLIPALHAASGSRALAVVVSSLAFGMLHSYQGAVGVLRASVLGALLSAPLLATGSVYPSIAAHALYDLIAGLLLADWLLRRGDRADRDGS